MGLVYLLVVAWGPTPAFRQPWSILIFAALTGLGVEAFRRLTVREHPAVATPAAFRLVHRMEKQTTATTAS